MVETVAAAPVSPAPADTVAPPQAPTPEELYEALDAAGKCQPLAPDAAGRYHSQVLPGFFVERGWLWPATGEAADALAALRALALL